VERRLPVAAARVNSVRVLLQHAAHLVEHLELHRMVDLGDGAARDQKRRQPRFLPGAVEHVKAARPPVALLVDVRAGAEKSFYLFTVPALHGGEQRGLAEGATLQRPVKGAAHRRPPQPGMRNAPIRVEYDGAAVFR
jgi:hypothetical protein